MARDLDEARQETVGPFLFCDLKLVKCDIVGISFYNTR